MSRLWKLAVALILLSLVGACSEQKEAPPQTPKQEVSKTDVKKEVKEAASTATAWTEQQMADYRKKLDAKLAEADAELQQLRERAATMTDQARAELQQQLEVLQQKRDDLSAKAEELKSASGQAWDDLKAGTESALADLDQSLRNAMARFKPEEKK